MTDGTPHDGVRAVAVVAQVVGSPLAAAFAGNAAWEIAFPLIGVSVPLVPLVLLFCIVAATAVAWARLQDLRVEALDRVLPAAVTGLLLGWAG